MRTNPSFRIFKLSTLASLGIALVAALLTQPTLASLVGNSLVIIENSPTSLTAAIDPLVGSPGVQPDPKTITINFELSHFGNALLTPAQREAVVAKVQQEFNDAVGPGVIEVSEGQNGNVQVNVVNSGGKNGPSWGITDVANGQSTVFGGTFEKNGFEGDALVNGIAETAAHEAGHQLGLFHNRDNPPSKMTAGSRVDIEERKKDMRKFNNHDKEVLKRNLSVTNPLPKPTTLPDDLKPFIGKPVMVPTNIPDENSLDAFVQFSGPTGAQFGYIGASGQFVFEGDTSDNAYFRQTGLFTFLFSVGYNLAVRFDNQISSLENGEGTFSLSNRNPDDPSVFSTADLSFSTTGGQATLVLNATVMRTTGGFSVADSSTTITLLAIGLVGLILGYRCQRRAASRGVSEPPAMCQCGNYRRCGVG